MNKRNKFDIINNIYCDDKCFNIDKAFYNI